jgi:hypothetical protein
MSFAYIGPQTRPTERMRKLIGWKVWVILATRDKFSRPRSVMAIRANTSVKVKLAQFESRQRLRRFAPGISTL